MASELPVLPPVSSTTRIPGRSTPCASAASTSPSAIRSFMLPVGFAPSHFIQTWAPAGWGSLRRRMSGVPPTPLGVPARPSGVAPAPQRARVRAYRTGPRGDSVPACPAAARRAGSPGMATAALDTWERNGRGDTASRSGSIGSFIGSPPGIGSGGSGEHTRSPSTHVPSE